MLCILMLSVAFQVCGVTQGGGFAREVIIKEGGVVKLPTHVDLVAAAGLPVIFGTAHLAIKERAQVKPGVLTSMPQPLLSSNSTLELQGAMTVNGNCLAVCFSLAFAVCCGIMPQQASMHQASKVSSG